MVQFKAGQPLWSAAGGIHVAEVTLDQPITIVEMELRKPSGKNAATPLDPLQADPRHYSLEFENHQVRVFRVKIGPRETTAMYEHILGRVTVYLTDQKARIVGPAGKTDVQTRKAGDIVWAEGGKRRDENLSDQPFEAVVVELK